MPRQSAVAQRVEHVADRPLDQLLLRVRNRERDARVRAFELGQDARDVRDRAQGVARGRALEVDRDGGLAVPVVGALRFLDAQPHVRHVPQIDRAARPLGDRDQPDVAGVLELAGPLDEELAVGGHQQPDGLVRVERHERLADVERREVVALEPIAVEIDPHDRLVRAEHLGVGDLRQLEQPFLDGVVGQLAHHCQVQRRARLRAEGERHDGRRRRGDLEEHRRPRRLGQKRPDLLEVVGDVGRGRVEALRVLELHHHRRHLVLGDRGDADHALDPRQLLLDGPADVGLDVRGRRAGHHGHHRDLRRIGVREQVHLHPLVADEPHDGGEEHEGRDEVRTPEVAIDE